MNNETLKNIKERRSIRAFKKEQIPDEILKAVLEAGTYAPTSRGMQAPIIVAVQNELLKEKLANLNAQIMEATSNPYYNAPTYILVMAPDDARYPIHDCSCVLENMMIAAQSLGIGTCWIHREKEMFECEEGKKLLLEMGLQENMIGVGALAIGYPEGTPSPAKPRKPDYFRIIK